MADPLDALLTSWTLDLRARDLSPNTEIVYLRAAHRLAHHAQGAGVTDWGQVTRDLIRQHITNLLGSTSPATASNHYRALQQLFQWLHDEDEIPTNPMAGMRGPTVTPRPVPVIGEADLRRLLATVGGRDFLARRDNAILRLLLDTGIRLAEAAGLHTAHVDLGHREATVTGKGRRVRTVRFGFKTAKAIDRYLRVRAAHPNADTAWLWLAPKRVTPLSANGIHQVVRRRGAAVGLRLHPHKFRHTFAHLWLDQGGAEGDLMEMAGWTSRQMLERYGASARHARALRSYDRVQIGDRF